MIVENVGIKIYPSFRRDFNISAPILAIVSTPSSDLSLLSPVPFQTMFYYDPWSLPSPSTLDEYARYTRMKMSLSTENIVYQATLDPVVGPDPSSSGTENEDLIALPSWAVASSCLYDFLDSIWLQMKLFLRP